MADHDAFAERGRALEEEYFRKKDRELLEKMRRQGAAEQAQQDLSRSTGVSDPTILAGLQELGFTPDTIALLPLMPLIQVAWAEGGITAAERIAIVKLARQRQIAEGSAADAQLTAWLAQRPDDSVFARAGRLIGAMLDANSLPTGQMTADELVKQCEEIASLSGGIFGMGKVSAEERTLLASIAADLKRR